MSENRLLFIDNVRLLVIIMVVMQHLAVTYSGFGSWYYVEPAELGIVQTIIFGFYQAFSQGFFMGLLFLIAGYFIPDTYNKKGFGNFLKDRFIRLGIPTLIYMLIIHPLLAFAILGYRYDDYDGWVTFGRYLSHFDFIGNSGPLWFAFALLIFTVIYAILRKLSKDKEVIGNGSFPAFPKILFFIVLMGLISYLVRIVQPVGTSVINMQLCHFTQYVMMFFIGIKARCHDWLNKLTYKTGKTWFVWGLILGFVIFAVMMILGGALDGNLGLFDGLGTWQSFAYALWESFVAVAMAIGLLALFREKFNKQNSLIKAMSVNTFAVYVFHSVIVVLLTMFFSPVRLLPIFKFLIMVFTAVPLCFIIVNFTIQKIPFLRKIFS